MNISILYLTGEYVAQSESCSECYSKCYVTFTFGIVPSQCPSSGDGSTWSPKSGCLKMLKRTQPQRNKSTINLSGSLKVVLFILTLMGHQISLSLIGMDSMVLCARLRYTPDYLTPGICLLINPGTEKMMSFPAKSSQLCHDKPLEHRPKGSYCTKCKDGW